MTAVLGVSVAETILSLTPSLPADLIALATHGAGGVRRFVLGSVADKVMRAAECPVLAVRLLAPSRALASNPPPGSSAS
jgi:nucleotide-binding universal stress UspA family protein